MADAINMKIVIIGDGAVGKTSLFLTYVKKGFPSEYEPTVMDNYQATLRIGNGQVLNLDVWDTAGQEEFDGIRALSYPHTNVFIICYSCVSRGSLQNVKTLWVPEMRSTAPKIPFVLCGTKQDLATRQPDKYVSEMEARAMCKELGGYDAIQCSALQYSRAGQSNVDEVFRTAITCGLKNMHIGGTSCCQCAVL